ncbi:MAG TPA: 50S ribosome-binding GTPase, partial [Spirochaetota bacterium]|nr:50S ribosome-binding GTPase [Spirochaetota bacterium]
MSKFTDTITISVQAGHGGPGAVAFRREKYIPKGGPDGGDGGKGGDVFLEADRRYYNLSHLFKDRVYKAENGKQGMGDNRHGKDGGDLIIKVPPGTQILDDNENVIADLVEEGMRCLVATGGVGGRGNTFFKTSTHQTPRFAQPGMPGDEKFLVLNLKLIADIGLVGLPNAGKSTLLSRLTNAR